MTTESLTNRLRRIFSAVDKGTLPDNLFISVDSGTLDVRSSWPYDTDIDEAVYLRFAAMFPGGTVRRESIPWRRKEPLIEKCSYYVPDVITVYFSREHTEHDGEYTADTRDRGSNQRWMTWRHTCCGRVLLVREMKAAGLYQAFTP
jgi:hypothetical protein